MHLTFAGNKLPLVVKRKQRPGKAFFVMDKQMPMEKVVMKQRPMEAFLTDKQRPMEEAFLRDKQWPMEAFFLTDNGLLNSLQVSTFVYFYDDSLFFCPMMQKLTV